MMISSALNAYAIWYWCNPLNIIGMHDVQCATLHAGMRGFQVRIHNNKRILLQAQNHDRLSRKLILQILHMYVSIQLC